MAAAVDIPRPSISSSATLASGSTAAPYSASVSVLDAVAPFAVSISSGSLPPGITMSYSDTHVTFAGQPTVDGVYTFTVTVTLVVRP